MSDPIPPPATPPSTPAQGETPAPEPQPFFDVAFAAVIGLAVIAVAVLIVASLNLLNGQAGFSDSDWSSFEGRLKVGAMMGLPLTIIGSLAVLVGIWMALVEWRGRFAKVEKQSLGGAIRPTDLDLGNADKVIEALGKLRGAALSMVVGAILLIASAWIAQSAAGTTPSSTPTESPSEAQ